MKIRPMEAELFQAGGGQTDRHDEANSRLSQFCERAYKANCCKSDGQVPSYLHSGFRLLLSFLHFQTFENAVREL
jgi:hypothetical protein